MAKPQLPITVVVTPCQMLLVVTVVVGHRQGAQKGGFCDGVFFGIGRVEACDPQFGDGVEGVAVEV